MGLTIEQLLNNWENFCWNLDFIEVDYTPTQVDGVMDGSEMMCLFDATVEAFQEEMGYSNMTRERLHSDPCFIDAIDIWFQRPWREAGYTWKEDEG